MDSVLGINFLLEIYCCLPIVVLVICVNIVGPPFHGHCMMLNISIASGESMENALRACCKGIKIGKILIHREGDNGQQVCAYLWVCVHVFHFLYSDLFSINKKCFIYWAANLWKVAFGHLRKACITIGSYPRDRFVVLMWKSLSFFELLLVLM